MNRRISWWRPNKRCRFQRSRVQCAQATWDTTNEWHKVQTEETAVQENQMWILWTHSGLRRHENWWQKHTAIKQMSAQKDKKGLQSFLRMVNYLNRYSVQVITISEPLKPLSVRKCGLDLEFHPTRCFWRDKRKAYQDSSTCVFQP